MASSANSTIRHHAVHTDSDMGLITEEAINAVIELAQTLNCTLLSYHSSRYPIARTGPQRYLFPTGPFAVGLYHPGDEVHLVCMTDNSVSTFWSCIAERLDREDLHQQDRVVRDLPSEGRVWLHYCSIPAGFDLATLAEYGFPSARDLAKEMQRTRERLGDSWSLTKAVQQDGDGFREAYRLLRGWAESWGIFSQRKLLGMLDADSLLWMLHHAGIGEEEAEPHYLRNAWIRPFLKKYQHLEELDVRTPTGQVCLERSEAHKIIAREMKRGLEDPTTFKQNPESKSQRASHVLDSYPLCITISAECWAPKQRASFETSLIAGTARLLRELKATGLIRGLSRIWPEPFCSSPDEWVYAILSENWLESGIKSVAPTKQLRAFLSTFVFEIDSSLGCASAAPDTGTLKQKLGAQIRGDLVLEYSTHMIPPAAAFAKPEDLRASCAKNPTASQMLSRLRWDPAHSAQSYEVGYMDRFEGLMWTPLESWGHATEEEEFIPEHRIRVIRRMGAGEAGVVWERRGKVNQAGELIA